MKMARPRKNRPEHRLIKAGRGLRCVDGCERGLDGYYLHRYDPDLRLPKESYRKKLRLLKERLRKRLSALSYGERVTLRPNREHDETRLDIMRLALSVAREDGFVVSRRQSHLDDTVTLRKIDPSYEPPYLIQKHRRSTLHEDLKERLKTLAAGRALEVVEEEDKGDKYRGMTRIAQGVAAELGICIETRVLGGQRGILIWLAD